MLFDSQSNSHDVMTHKSLIQRFHYYSLALVRFGLDYFGVLSGGGGGGGAGGASGGRSQFGHR